MEGGMHKGTLPAENQNGKQTKCEVAPRDGWARGSKGGKCALEFGLRPPSGDDGHSVAILDSHGKRVNYGGSFS